MKKIHIVHFSPHTSHITTCRPPGTLGFHRAQLGLHTTHHTTRLSAKSTVWCHTTLHCTLWEGNNVYKQPAWVSGSSDVEFDYTVCYSFAFFDLLMLFSSPHIYNACISRWCSHSANACISWMMFAFHGWCWQHHCIMDAISTFGYDDREKCREMCVVQCSQHCSFRCCSPSFLLCVTPNL